MVDKVEVAFYVECKGWGDFAGVPGHLDAGDDSDEFWYAGEAFEVKGINSSKASGILYCTLYSYFDQVFIHVLGSKLGQLNNCI